MAELQKRRIWELDALRGFCILCMIVVHLFFDLSYFMGFQANFPALCVYIQEYGGTIFVLISGICVTLGSHSVKRGAIVFGCGMKSYFDAVFISEQMGCKKPEKAFFDKVFESIGPEKRNSCLLVGDSLSSDMQGGRNAGVPTCFYGRPENADDRCDYVIGDLMDLLKLL